MLKLKQFIFFDYLLLFIAKKFAIRELEKFIIFILIDNLSKLIQNLTCSASHSCFRLSSTASCFSTLRLRFSFVSSEEGPDELPLSIAKRICQSIIMQNHT